MLSDGSLFICFGSPTTIRSTGSFVTYCFRNVSSWWVGTVVRPFATICSVSVTAIPVRFRP